MKIKGYWAVVFTPEGGTDIAFKARKGKPNPDDGRDVITDEDMDTENHLLVSLPDIVVKVGGGYDLSEIYDVSDDVMSIAWGLNAQGLLGAKIIHGVASVTFHSYKDAAATPQYEHLDFNCQVGGELDTAFSEHSAGSIKLKQLGGGSPTMKIKGVAIA